MGSLMDLHASDQLRAETLLDLVHGRTALIRQAEFLPTDQCQAVLPRIVEVCERAKYTLTDDFQSIGTSMGEASETSDDEQRYLATAAQTTGLIRDYVFAGRLSPLDRLRLLLDEIWPAGASIARSGHQMLLPGIIRRWPAGGQANPHIDQRDIPLLKHYSLRSRIGVNVYIEVPLPGNGGDIDFWELIDEHGYRERRRTDYGLDRDTLGEPTWSCLPGRGELLMFDASRIHGVRKVVAGSRVTAACFVGVRSDDEPLVVFA
jgi:hypothetical protein